MKRSLKGTDEYDMLQDFFRYVQNYHEEGPEDDGFSLSVADAGLRLCQKYKDKDCHIFAGLLVEAHLMNLARQNETKDMHYVIRVRGGDPDMDRARLKALAEGKQPEADL